MALIPHDNAKLTGWLGFRQSYGAEPAMRETTKQTLHALNCLAHMKYNRNMPHTHSLDRPDGVSATVSWLGGTSNTQHSKQATRTCPEPFRTHLDQPMAP